MHAPLCFAIAGMAILVWLGWMDITQRRLPNASILLFAVLFPAVWLLGNKEEPILLGHAGTAVGSFLLFTIFYAFGWMAGGDVKLAAAVLFWAGPEHAAGALMVTALSGIFLAVGQLLAKPYVAPDSVWHASRGTPYGVALAAGGLWAIWRLLLGGSALF